MSKILKTTMYIAVFCLIVVLCPFIFVSSDLYQDTETSASTYTLTVTTGGGTDADHGAYNAGSSSWCRSSGEVLCCLGGRYFYKKNSTRAIVAIIYQPNGWECVYLISTTSTGARYFCDYCSSNGIDYCAADGSGYSGYVWFNSGTNRWYSASTYSSASSYVTKYYWTGGSHAMQNAPDSYNKYFRFSVSNSATKEQTVLDILKKSCSTDKTVTYGSTVGSLPSKDPVRFGYTFLGYYSNRSGSLGTQLTASTVWTWASNKTFYARFIPESYMFDMMHDPESESSWTETLKLGPYDYYEFLDVPESWWDAYSEYPSWEHVGYWTVSLMKTSGSVYASGECWGSNTPLELAQELCGSSYDPELRQFSVVSSWVFNENIIEFYDEENGGYYSILVDADWVYFYFPDAAETGFSKFGYKLVGWYSDYIYFEWMCGEEIDARSLLSLVGLEFRWGSAATMYPIWEERATITVKAQTSTGIASAKFSASVDGVTYLTSVSSSSAVYAGSTVTFTRTLNSGYSFAGWYNSSTRVSTSATYSTTISSNLTLTAKATAQTATIYVKVAIVNNETWPDEASAGVELYYCSTSGYYSYLDCSGGSQISVSALATSTSSISYISSYTEKLSFVDCNISTSGFSYSWDSNYVSLPGSILINSNLTSGAIYYVTVLFQYFEDAAVLKYDLEKGFYYVEDGEFPQTFVGTSMNSTLNGWYTSNSETYTTMVNGKNVSVYTYTNGKKYARIQATTTGMFELTSETISFSSGTYYWFEVEKIKWRLTDYHTSSYPAYLGITMTNVKTVCDVVLDWAQYENGSVQEGWGLINSDLWTNGISQHQKAQTNHAFSFSFDYHHYNGSATNKVLETMSGGIAAFVPVSVAEVSECFEDARTYASDLVCMLAGINYDDYCNYWCRDLMNIGSGYYITNTGISRSRWLNSYCGVRYVYGISSIVYTGNVD